MALKFLIALTIAGGGFLFANSADAATIIPDRTVINEHITWTKANSPYVVSGLMLIQSGGKLVIEPGTVVKSHFGTRIANPGGILEAVGTLEEPIVFTSIADDTIAGDTNGDLSASAPNRDDWNGISLTGGTGSRLEHVQVRYAVNCINIDSPNVVVKNTTVQYCNNGIGTGASFQGTVEMNTAQFNSVGISGSHIKNIIFKNNTASDNVVGFFVEDFFGGGIILENNDITRNNFGIRTVGQGVTVVNNNIYENHILGALVFPDSSVLEASGNWWGDASGPLNVTGNPDGLGNGASDWINFEPWLTEPFGKQQPPSKTPVLIIPGIAGTELHKDNNLIWIDKTKLFFDVDDEFIAEDLSLDIYGDSLSSIVVGNAINDVRIRIPSLGIDTQLLDILKGLTQEIETNEFALNESYFLFPYDWRLDLDQTKILLNQKIEAIKSATGSDKVDIISHSTGGILAKNYIDEFGKESINKLIFIGVPHLGAPKAAKVILKGDRFSIPFLEPDAIRQIAKNSPALHQLTPNQIYFENFSGYISPYNLRGRTILDYDDTKQFLIDKGDNAFLQNNLENFFAKNLHNIDLSGIDVYNIAGCKTATQAAYRFGIGNRFISSIGYTSGDETVPLVSADYVNTPNKYYVLNPKHSEMPSWNGVRELITGILLDNPQLSENVRQDKNFCGFRGKTLIWRSPVAVHIYDALGNHSGPIEGGLENNIPGVDYESFDGEKFIFLSTDAGQVYSIEGFGESTGTFDLLISKNDNNTVTETKVFNDVVINDQSLVNLEISGSSSDDSIRLDINGTGVSEIITVEATLDSEQSEDFLSPTTTAVVTGIAGNNGWFKSDVSIELRSSDDNAGVLETLYSTDGINFNPYNNPVALSQEGIINLQYYSVDRAGNNEGIKTLEIKIDRTPPEFLVEFDPENGKFIFETTDNLDNDPSILCTTTSCTGNDQAGNSSKLDFKLRDGKIYHRLDLRSIKYNDYPSTDLYDNAFVVEFREKKDIPRDFDQIAVIKKQERARINYQKRKNQSIVTQKHFREKKIKEAFSGFKFLQLITKQGNLDTSIK
ncbi:MAG: hypothetical protein A3C85_03155 [Candidatus Doudnabacteria bacterium RIFCSPHIGHO2_02_FULL_48_21]|uniref:Periplasmic copper-binding protein NosD beta helix domain-containing protein n=1 Tax=Candidatus Doudnabacteria bacterium RIFCSPLOWO2_02_FULL_48_13 TaxID=1817845 RepID=A0A1F5QCE4_9BACT|nr:MAG: hypothetical protein A3K05_02395 [Candidatus Doudnabacteria bacterium RIFCSPHIGHO2_01_48_18]OGE91271.1 MAG: hypothetical protein A3F44_04585 [Candidatus Doudnabacteria bacterium RIFCSPHIGHO2_12_FULL_47_25]OGE93526.1 MAG: hypothetical protein A3C85_03155 [Candidatus Doudnabacteria bacterium RIFCSPHIGHO2_02_FULL_48_21]OGE99797.1 MAG: hypothetical protein A3J05_00810 [Candidatus Doudnabacteria bacterium RIFCSPLOWO2_02_FULL_48_13]OGF00528.1 MAG: hypothetical protein A3G07_02410 [Candidatus 